jgi:hypothetical protein
LPAIVQTRNAMNVMRGKNASDFDPEILDGHEFELEFLTNGAVIPALLGKSSSGLALEFALADIANISAYHEAKQMLGINTLGMNAGWKQRG